MGNALGITFIVLGSLTLLDAILYCFEKVCLRYSAEFGLCL
jgi:hypothetical protein